MKLGKFVLAFLVLAFVFSGLQIQGQGSKPRKRIKILDSSGAIPFEDGKTIVSEVAFTGLKEIDESDVSTALRQNQAAIQPDDEFYGNKVAKAAKTIREFLCERGYLNAAVAAFGEKLADNRMKLDFVIRQGERARVSEIRFEGAQHFSNLELVEDLKQCSGDDWETFEARRLNFYLQTCSRRLLLSRGFIKAKIREPRLLKIDGEYIIEIDVEEGDRYRTGEVKITGAKLFSRKELIKMLGVEEGEILNGRELQKSIYEKLKRIYAEQGYILYNAEFDVDFIEPQVKTLDGSVNLEITIDEGPKFKLRAIEFIGIDDQKTRKLRSLFSLNDGDVYNQAAIEAAIKKINELEEYCPLDADRDIEVKTDEAKFVVDLIVKLKENK